MKLNSLSSGLRSDKGLILGAGQTTGYGRSREKDASNMTLDVGSSLNYYSYLLAFISVLAVGEPRVSIAGNDSEFSLAADGTPSFSWYVEAELGYYKSRGSAYSDSLNYQDLLVQYTSDIGWGTYGYAYNDDEFTAAYLGVTYTYENMGVAVGAGPARYDDKNWNVINSWAYYEGDFHNASLYVEYVPEDVSSAEWFYKLQVDRYFGDYFYLGIYSERWYGTGPLIGVSFSEHISAQVSLPIFDKEDMSYAASVLFVF